MRKLFTLFIALACTLAACNDPYDDSEISKRLDEIEQRLQKLERLCNDLNTNLGSVQSIVNALDSGDYITAVDPLTENGTVVGYTIRFAKGMPIVVYNGQNAAAPVIAVKKDTDGTYYWTLDGNWITGDDGQKLPVSGTDGHDAIAPKLKIEDDFWYISYDDGQTWTKLQKAVGENGNDATGITVDMDEKYVYFTLPDGQTVTVPRVSEVPFVLTLSDAGPVSFRVAVEPRDPQENYYVGITTRADFDRLQTAQAVAEAFVEIEKKHGQIDWTKPDDKLIFRGSAAFDADASYELRPKSAYAVVVFGVGADGAITTDVCHDFISTTEVQPSDNELTVSVAPESAIVTVTTTASDPYFLDCIEAKRIEGYPTDKLAEHLIGSYGTSISACIETGNVTRDFTRLLEEDTDYCAVAFGYLGGYATTEITVIPFHTPGGELKPQDCTFTASVSDITLQGATIAVEPSNPATPYFWQVYNTTLIESYRKGPGLAQLMTDGLGIIAEVLSEQAGIEITLEKAAGMVTTTGRDSYIYTTLDPATTYCVVAVGLDNKARQTTEVYVSEPFETLTPGGTVTDPMECTITVNGMTDEGLSVTVTPADKQMTYVGMAGEAEFYTEFSSDAEYLTDDLLMWTEMAAGEQMTLVEMLTEYGLFLQGDQTYIFPEQFEPGKLYLAYTYGLNEQGELTTGMQKTFFTIDDSGAAHPAEAPAAASLRKLYKRPDPRFAACRPAPDAVRTAVTLRNAAAKRAAVRFE